MRWRACDILEETRAPRAVWDEVERIVMGAPASVDEFVELDIFARGAAQRIEGAVVGPAPG